MRNELLKRPLVTISAALCIGIAAARYGWPALWMLPLIGLCSRLPFRSREWLHGVALVGFFALGWVVSPRPATSWTGVRPYTGIVQLLDHPQTHGTYTVALVRSSRETFTMAWRQNVRYEKGSWLAVTGTATALREDPYGYQSDRGVVGRVRASELRMVEPPGTLQSFSNAVRNHFLDVLSAGPRDQATAFLKALVISDESDVLTETWDTLRSTGTVHIVSVSGYHVFIISAGMLWVASLFPIPRGLQLAGVAMLLLAYLGITGLTGPIVRSALMVAVLGCATLIRREPDPLSALGLSGLIFLIFEPGAAFRPGFQLSFVAVGALSVFLDGSGDRTITAWCGDLVRGTLVASAATAPLVAYHFGSLPVFGILGNAAIALPAPFVLSAGFLLCISPSPIAEGMLVSLRPLLGWILESARLISQIPFAQVSVPEFSGYWLPVVYVGGLMMWRSVRREP